MIKQLSIAGALVVLAGNPAWAGCSGHVSAQPTQDAVADRSGQLAQNRDDAKPLREQGNRPRSGSTGPTTTPSPDELPKGDGKAGGSGAATTPQSGTTGAGQNQGSPPGTSSGKGSSGSPSTEGGTSGADGSESGSGGSGG
ncbi:MAG: hypothetical protein AB7R90_17765 [Reyranellaceae bacterium]